MGNIAINYYVVFTSIYQPSSEACDSVSQFGYYMYFENLPFFKLDIVLFLCPMLGAMIYTYKHNCIFYVKLNYDHCCHMIFWDRGFTLIKRSKTNALERSLSPFILFIKQIQLRASDQLWPKLSSHIEDSFSLQM